MLQRRRQLDVLKATLLLSGTVDDRGQGLQGDSKTGLDTEHLSRLILLITTSLLCHHFPGENAQRGGGILLKVTELTWQSGVYRDAGDCSSPGRRPPPGGAPTGLSCARPPPARLLRGSDGSLPLKHPLPLPSRRTRLCRSPKHCQLSKFRA